MLNRRTKPLWSPAKDIKDVEPSVEEAKTQDAELIDNTVNNDPGDEQVPDIIRKMTGLEVCTCPKPKWPSSGGIPICRTCNKHIKQK